MSIPSRSHASRRRLHSWRCSVLLLAPFVALFLSTAAADLGVDVTAPALREETLLLDSRVPLKQHGEWVFLSGEEPAVLRRREDVASTAVTATSTTKATTKTAKTTSKPTTGSATTKTTKTTRTTTASASPLPSIFDSSLGANFTANSACPSFINNFLVDATFKSCYPFSLLVQGSRSFFEAETSLVSITQVLDATCAANVTFCTSYLADLAANLTETANCGQDYQLGNSIVTQAYIGMLSYNVLYTASCLKDPDSSLYCYANAITNTTTPSNVYFYYLPLNISLPASTKPSCNACLKNTMAVYRTAAADRRQPIAATYLSAAQQVDSGAICGPGFADNTLPAPVTSAGQSRLPRGASVPWLVPVLSLSLAVHLVLS